MATATKSIDRQSTTPFHLKLFYKSSGFHPLSEFPVPTSSNPAPSLPSHLQIYTWLSCDLHELSHLLTSALPNILPSPVIGTRLSFRLVYPDTRPSGGREEGRGRYISKEIGSVVVAPEPEDGDGTSTAMNFSGDDLHKTLEDSRFIIGDYVDCAIFPPLADGSVAPPQTSGRGNYNGRSFGGPPENGYNRPRGGSYGEFRGGSRNEFGSSVPTGEWRRGERLPEPSFGGRGYGRGRGRGF